MLLAFTPLVNRLVVNINPGEPISLRQVPISTKTRMAAASMLHAADVAVKPVTQGNSPINIINMKTDPKTIIILFVSIWTTVSLLFGWLLIASEKARKARQKIKFPYEWKDNEE